MFTAFRVQVIKSKVETILTDGTPDSVLERSLNASRRRIRHTPAANSFICRVLSPRYLPAGNASGGFGDGLGLGRRRYKGEADILVV